jgi:Tfp pilus assembly protein PilE
MRKKREGFTVMEVIVTLLTISVVMLYTFSSYRDLQSYSAHNHAYSQMMFEALAENIQGINTNEVLPNGTIKKTTITEVDGMRCISTEYTSKNINVTFTRMAR